MKKRKDGVKNVFFPHIMNCILENQRKSQMKHHRRGKPVISRQLIEDGVDEKAKNYIYRTASAIQQATAEWLAENEGGI